MSKIVGLIEVYINHLTMRNVKYINDSI